MAQPNEIDQARLDILIADDEASIFDALSRFLRRAGDGRKILAHLTDDPSCPGVMVPMSGGSAADYENALDEGVQFVKKGFAFEMRRNHIGQKVA